MPGIQDRSPSASQQEVKEMADAIAGDFARLSRAAALHSRLCRYVEMRRLRREHFTIAQEYYTTGLRDYMYRLSHDRLHLLTVAYEILHALDFLHQHGIIHRNLDLDNIRIDEDGHVKLAGYGLYSMTNCGRRVRFFVGHPLYVPPEVVVVGPSLSSSIVHNWKADTWAFGIVLMTLLRRAVPLAWSRPVLKAIPTTYTFLTREWEGLDPEQPDEHSAQDPATEPQADTPDTPKEHVLSDDTPFFATAAGADFASRPPPDVNDWCPFHRDPDLKYDLSMARFPSWYARALEHTDAPSSTRRPAGRTRQTPHVAEFPLPVAHMSLKAWFDSSNLSDDLASPELVDLLQHCLSIDPAKRKTPGQLLGHPAFDEVRENLNRVHGKQSLLTTAHHSSAFCHRPGFALLSPASLSELPPRQREPPHVQHSVWADSLGLKAPGFSTEELGFSELYEAIQAAHDQDVREARMAQLGQDKQSDEPADEPSAPNAQQEPTKPSLLPALYSPAEPSVHDLRLSKLRDMRNWPIEELYYLWCEKGGSSETVLAAHGRLSLSPAVRRIPRVVFVGARELVDSARANVVLNEFEDSSDSISRHHRHIVPVSLREIAHYIEEAHVALMAQREPDTSTLLKALEAPKLAKEVLDNQASPDGMAFGPGDDDSDEEEEEEEEEEDQEQQQQQQQQQQHQQEQEQQEQEQQEEALDEEELEQRKRQERRERAVRKAREGSLRSSIEQFMQYHELLRHYPATRAQILQMAQASVHEYLRKDARQQAAIRKAKKHTTPQQRDSAQALYVRSTQLNPPFPPVLRRALWPAILGVNGDVKARFQRYVSARERPSEFDEQLARDIPRCHQYNRLLCSELGHQRLRRVLKAWLAVRPELHKYWQGLDSVAAPFVSLFFDEEELAFCCFERLVGHYLGEFFNAEDSAFKRRMSQLVQLLSFHDPELASHLNHINFNPELYSVPWFFTLFAHVLPLEQIYVLWDFMLLHPPSFVLFIALAILTSVRDKLLHLDFNGCIMFFANLAAVDIERCLHEALVMYDRTPRSFYHVDAHTPDAQAGQERERTRAPAATASELYLASSGGGTHAVMGASDTLLISPLIAADEVFERRASSLVVDLREASSYTELHWSGSIHLPMHEDSVPADVVTMLFDRDELLDYGADQVLVVVGGMNENQTALFTQELMKASIPHVCVLRGGFTSMRASDKVRPLLESDPIEDDDGSDADAGA